MLTHEYHYDDAYRLERTTVEDATQDVVRDTTYTLDGVHNREQVTGDPDDGPHVGDYTMDEGDPLFDYELNQYTTIPVNAPRLWDKNGN